MKVIFLGYGYEGAEILVCAPTSRESLMLAKAMKEGVILEYNPNYGLKITIKRVEGAQ